MLAGKRGNQKIVWEIPLGERKISMKPPLEDLSFTTNLHGKAWLDKKDIEKAIA